MLNSEVKKVIDDLERQKKNFKGVWESKSISIINNVIKNLERQNFSNSIRIVQKVILKGNKEYEEDFVYDFLPELLEKLKKKQKRKASMKSESIKSFLEEGIINRETVLDKAYKVLSKKMSNKEIEKSVNRIVKNSKTEKEALKKVEELKQPKKEENVSFDDRVKKYLREEAVEDTWESKLPQEKKTKISKIIDTIIEPEGDGEIEDWEVPSEEVERLALKNEKKIKKKILEQDILTDEFVKNVDGGKGWQGLIRTVAKLS